MTLAIGAWSPARASKAHAIDAELLSLPNHEASQPLAAGLQTHDQTELLLLLDELGPGPEAAQSSRAVADLLRAGQPDVVADHALDALGRLRSREARGVLLTFCRHRRSQARLRAYAALASLRDPRDVSLISEGLRDSAPQVRARVAELLGELHAVQAVPDLLRALELGVHPAAAALGKLGDPASVEALGRQLGKLPLSVMLEGYAQYLDRADIPEAVKLGIIAALEEVSGPVVKEFLNTRLQHPGKNTTPKLQQAMATSAGRIRVEPVSPAPTAPRAVPQEVQP